MKISGSLLEDYILLPDYGEGEQFRKLFGGKILPAQAGWTPSIYNITPQFLVKGNTYFGQVADHTRAYDTKSETLRALGLAVSLVQNRPLPARKGLYMPNFKILTHNSNGYQCSGLPMVNMIAPNDANPDRIIISMSGDYHFNTGIFSGNLDFGDLKNVWRE